VKRKKKGKEINKRSAEGAVEKKKKNWFRKKSEEGSQTIY